MTQLDGRIKRSSDSPVRATSSLGDVLLARSLNTRWMPSSSARRSGNKTFSMTGRNRWNAGNPMAASSSPTRP